MHMSLYWSYMTIRKSKVMKIHVSEDKTIRDIQEEFQHNFPYLKIEFFHSAHRSGESSPKEKILDSKLSLRDCRWLHQSGSLTYSPQTTVGELEQAFRETFGLSVQVFRRSGKTYLQTTVTDPWTLEEQNSEGMMASLTV